ncbi:ChbG/HpnK family deacetylase [Pseudonocardia adelaidensis]|uniref:ChbG/HpnK family deacetylase n=1 Tax=Pseudonocardia adelaidensis TaxID=648754 RepID=A0ABP9NFQ3_9PSEU
MWTDEQIGRLLARASVEEVEREFRAQLDVVLAAGLHPTHLDFHSIADGGRDDVLDDVLDRTVALGAEHGLAVRVWLPAGRRAARGRGRPVVDHPFRDSTRLDPATEACRYAELLRALPPGLTEWAVHPATTDLEGERGRGADLDFLVSPLARELVAEEGVLLIDHRPLQDAWNARRVMP